MTPASPASTPGLSPDVRTSRADRLIEAQMSVTFCTLVEKNITLQDINYLRHGLITADAW